jgi:hypothetical protein
MKLTRPNTEGISQFQVFTTKIAIPNCVQVSEYTRSAENPICTSSALSRKETNQRASQLPHHKSGSANAQKFVQHQHKTYLTLEWHRGKHTIKCTLPVCCHKHKIVPCLICISHLAASFRSQEWHSRRERCFCEATAESFTYGQWHCWPSGFQVDYSSCTRLQDGPLVHTCNTKTADFSSTMRRTPLCPHLHIPSSSKERTLTTRTCQTTPIRTSRILSAAMDARPPVC